MRDSLASDASAPGTGVETPGPLGDLGRGRAQQFG